MTDGARTPTKPIPDPQQAAALALYDAAAVAMDLGNAVLLYLSWRRPDGRCIDSGAAELQIDGVSQGNLLGGSHTLSVAFDKCVVDGLIGTTLDGELSGAYSYNGEQDYRAQFSVRTMSGSNLAFASDLHAVIVDGSFTLSSVSTGTGDTASLAYAHTLASASGLRLTNTATGHVLTFGSGSFSTSFDVASRAGRNDFNALQLEINGASYTIDGSIHWTAGNSALNYASGTVLITRGGVVHASLAADPNVGLRVEVLVPLERL